MGQVLLSQVLDLLVGNLDLAHGILGVQHLLHGLSVGPLPGHKRGFGLVPLGDGGGQFYLTLG